MFRAALERAGCHPRGNGDSFRALCPSCQRDGGRHEPGLSVARGTERDVIWHCHGPGACDSDTVLSAAGVSWSDLDLDGNGARPRSRPVSTTRTSTRPEDLDAVVTRWQSALWEDPERLDFLRSARGLPDEIVRTARLGHDGERYTIPVFGEDGVVLFVRKYLPGGEPKFLSYPKGHSGAVLYGVETLLVLPDGALVIVAEGEMDALFCRALGCNAVSGTAGAKTWREEWSGRLARFLCVVIGDADADGAYMAEHVPPSLRKAGARAQPLAWPAGTAPKTDPVDYVVRDGHSAEDFRALVEQARRGEDQTSERARPEIIVREELSAVADEAVRALAAREDLRPYVRGRTLVCVARASESLLPWLRRERESVAILPVTRAHLRELFDRAAHWLKAGRDRQTGEIVHRDALPPLWVGETTEARSEWPFPPLRGITTAPTMRADGTILDREGYDPESGLVLDLRGVGYPAVPDNPTRDDAARAAIELLAWTCDFPFVAESDRAAVLATILSLLLRDAIDGPVPMTAVRAPAPGSGKGLLTQSISIVGTGAEPALMAAPRDDDEARKRILAIALEGVRCVLLDNVSGALGGDALAAALTATTWSDRILGESRTATAPLSAVWIATGNNLAFRGDLGRRVVPIDLDPGEEHPEDRTGFAIPDLLSHVREDRPRLVVAALTIARAHHVAGRPRHGFPRKGSFEAWDDLVRGAVHWAMGEDPLAGVERIRNEGDADLDTLRSALAVWSGMYGPEAATAAEAIERARSRPDALAALASLARCDPGRLNGSSLGYALRRVRDRIVNGQKFARDGGTHGLVRWRVDARG